MSNNDVMNSLMNQRINTEGYTFASDKIHPINQKKDTPLMLFSIDSFVIPM